MTFAPCRTLTAAAFSGHGIRMRYATIFGLLLAATTLEASGDAIVRVGLNTAGIPLRVVLMLAGAATLFCYGLLLNLARVDFGRLIVPTWRRFSSSRKSST
jgi:hypothetical protein